MLTQHVFRALWLLATLAFTQGVRAEEAKADPLAALTSPEQLEGLLASTKSPVLKKALTDHKAEILAALKLKENRDRIVSLLESAKASYTKVNSTPEALQKAIGGPSVLFDSLKTINLGDSSLTVKEKRKTDPFDAAFYESISKLPGLEELYIIHTTAQNDWLVPVGKMPSLKVLRIINQAKLNDAGLAHLAGLKQLETFSYIGTSMTGAPFTEFKGWTSLKSSSYRGSKMSDAGLIALVAAFPNLQSLVLAHGNYNDEALAHVAKLTKLTGLELGSHRATPAGLKPLTALKLEYLQLGDGLDATDGIAIIKDMKTLKKLVLTNCAKMPDEDLKTVAAMKHVENLELSSLEIPESRLPLLKEFSYLKTLRLPKGKMPYSDELKAQIKAALPGVMIKFE